MAMKVKGGQMVPAQQERPTRLTTTLLNGYVVEVEGTQENLQKIGQKLQSKGIGFTVRPGFQGKYELRIDVESALRLALKGVGLPGL
jgi:hypothetical protein